VGRSSGPEAVGARQEVRLEDGLQDQEGRHLHHPVAHRGDPHRAPLAVLLLDVDPAYGVRRIRLRPERLLEGVQEGCGSPGAALDLGDCHPVHPRCTLVGAHLRPGCLQRVAPIDPVVERVEPEPRLLLGLVVQLLSQTREALRQGVPPALGQPVPRQVLRSRILGIQAALPSSDFASLRHGPFAPRALPRFLATMGRSDSRPQPRGRLCIPAPALGYPPHWAGPPRFLDRSVGARCPHPPRRVRRVRLPVASSPVLASASLGAWPLSPSVTRPNRVRLRYGSRLRRARPHPPDCSGACSLGYMSTGNSHGDLLSGHKIGQACPGAPKHAEKPPVFPTLEREDPRGGLEHSGQLSRPNFLK
jgi:hypothetical protein